MTRSICSCYSFFCTCPGSRPGCDAVFTPKLDRERHRTIEDVEPTRVANYFELWRDLDGRRLPVSILRGSNKVVIKAQKDATITSVQLVTHSW